MQARPPPQKQPDTTPGPRKARRVARSKTQGGWEGGGGGGGGGKTHALVSPTPTDVANLLFRLTHPHTHLWLLGKKFESRAHK